MVWGLNLDSDRREGERDRQGTEERRAEGSAGRKAYKRGERKRRRTACNERDKDSGCEGVDLGASSGPYRCCRYRRCCCRGRSHRGRQLRKIISIVEEGGKEGRRGKEGGESV